MAGSNSTVDRTEPCNAKVVYWPVLYTPSSSRWPMLIWMLPWFFAGMSLLVHELQRKTLVSARHSTTRRQIELVTERAMRSAPPPLIAQPRSVSDPRVVVHLS